MSDAVITDPLAPYRQIEGLFVVGPAELDRLFRLEAEGNPLELEPSWVREVPVPPECDEWLRSKHWLTESWETRAVLTLVPQRSATSRPLSLGSTGCSVFPTTDVRAESSVKMSSGATGSSTSPGPMSQLSQSGSGSSSMSTRSGQRRRAGPSNRKPRKRKACLSPQWRWIPGRSTWLLPSTACGLGTPPGHGHPR